MGQLREVNCSIIYLLQALLRAMKQTYPFMLAVALVLLLCSYDTAPVIKGVTPIAGSFERIARPISNLTDTVKREVKVLEPAQHIHGNECLVFSLDKNEYNFGTMPNNRNIVLHFYAINKCTQPIVLTRLNTTCGCDVLEGPREPIMPGQKVELRYWYDGSRIGCFTKSPSVSYDTVWHVFKTKGIVEEVFPKDAPGTKQAEFYKNFTN